MYGSRGQSRPSKKGCGRLHRIAAGTICTASLVLLASMMTAGCEGKPTPQTPATQGEGKVVAESTTSKVITRPGGPGAVKVLPEPAPTPKPQSQPSRETPEEVAGVAFTEKLVQLLAHELSGRILGWRPNDLIFGRFTDDINEFQLGSLEAIRYTAVKLKETMTRFGDADSYDPHLIQAVNLLMNRADQFWFPSSESQYKSAVAELRGFVIDLRQGKSRFYYRTDNLLSLVASYKDLLGNCHENLVKDKEADGSPVSFFRADDYFYYAQGVAHVMYEMLKTVRTGFVEQLRTLDAVALMDKIITDLERAVNCEPWIITNGDCSSILANHRYHLAAPISSALNNMGTMLRY
jgi:hypothetical protein